MTKEEATEMLKALNMMLRSPDGEPISDVCDALDMAIEALQDKEGESQFYTEDDYWNGMFTESEEAYKAWTGEEIGKTGDLVKKKDAIAVAVKTCWNCSNYRCDEIKTALYALPTVSTDRPHGEWVDKGGYTECSECGEVAQKVELCDCVYERLTNYCPNCGADMRGKKNGDK